MVRIVVFSRSDEFHRSARRSIQQWGIAQHVLAARSAREITSTNGFDVLVVHDVPEDELDVVADMDQPIVLVGGLPEPSGDQGDVYIVMGPGSEYDPNRVIAAAVAAAHGLAVHDATDPSVFVRPDDSRSRLHGSAEPTLREIEVLQLISAGHPNRVIAERLGISENTVKYHLSGIFAKLGVANRTEATFEGLRRGIVTL